MSKQQTLFNERTFDLLTGGSMLHDARTAIVELVANSWDAGASRVDITWPESSTKEPFSIQDNGTGLTKEEFSRRWMQIGYERQKEQGAFVKFPSGKGEDNTRKAYGRNGLGRFSAFNFSTPYYVCTSKDGHVHSYKLDKSGTQFLDVEDIENEKAINGHGTIVYARESKPIALAAEDIKTEIGMRFLTDPAFSVYVNGKRISFFDIPDANKKTLQAQVDGQTINIIAIDIRATDRTTYHHGVAWHVNGRLVGECSWRGDNAVYALDGRTTAAKRFTFIVDANYLDQEDFIKPDWSGFNPKNEVVKRVFDAVHLVIKDFLLSMSESERKEIKEKIKASASQSLRKLNGEELEVWDAFISKIQEDCPSIKDKDLEHIGKILANLEASKSQYALLEKLGALKSDQLDDLDKILSDWTVQAAKEVLDEIQRRLAIVQQLSLKVESMSTLEVQELQPLFDQSLWIFGPEFESIEFTSNEGMTKVVSKLMGGSEKASLNRPDFAILPDGSCNMFSRGRYDYDCGGIRVGVAHLVIVELKRPSVPIDRNCKNQPLKYVDELSAAGHIDSHTKVTCFVLGRELDYSGREPLRESNTTVYPMTFQNVLENAKARLFHLQEKVKEAPFMKNKEMEEFIARSEEVRQQSEMNV